MGERIRDLTWQQLQLRVSVGVARNKLLAKLASAKAKPDGLLALSDDDVPPLLATTPVSRLPGVHPCFAHRKLPMTAACPVRVVRITRMAVRPSLGGLIMYCCIASVR